MKIVYDEREKIYTIILENEENISLIYTDDIVEARERFINAMKQLFNNTVRKQFKE